MKRPYCVCLFLLWTATFSLSQSNPAPVNQPAAGIALTRPSQPDAPTQSRILDGSDFSSSSASLSQTVN